MKHLLNKYLASYFQFFLYDLLMCTERSPWHVHTLPFPKETDSYYTTTQISSRRRLDEEDDSMKKTTRWRRRLDEEDVRWRLDGSVLRQLWKTETTTKQKQERRLNNNCIRVLESNICSVFVNQISQSINCLPIIEH